MKLLKELIQATILAMVLGGPMFAYFLFVME